MKITEIAVKHPVTTFMVFLGLSLIGIVSFIGIKLDLFPDVTYPTAAVFTVYPGVGPIEIESGITKLIEGATSKLNNVKKISSTSSEGISGVIINFNWGTNMDNIVSEIREKLIEVEDLLPEGAERPLIFRFNPEQIPSIICAISSATEGIDIRKLVEEEIIPSLEKIEGVATANVYGGKISAVTCKLKLDAITKMEIPILQIFRVFQTENINLPGGSISMENKQVVLRTIGEFNNIKDIGNVLVGYRKTVPVFLKDVADIDFGYLPQEEFVRTGDNRGVEIRIRKQSGHNTVKINAKVKEKLDILKKKLPPSLNIAIVSDQSTSILRSIGGMTDAAIQGGFLAVLVLLLFLRNIRSTVIISIAIPVSIIATFTLMNFGNITMNMLSLMGITLGVGMFVDNAIVVLESNYRKQLSGLSPYEAAVSGTREVSKAITASTLTTLAVFIPVIFVEGIAGMMFRDLSFTISFALAISLTMALTLIPVLCTKFLKIQSGITIHRTDLKRADLKNSELSLADVKVTTGIKLIDKIAEIIRTGLKKLDSNYEKIISWSIGHSALVIGFAILLFILSIGSIILMGLEFIPEADEGRFSVDIESRIGTPYNKTEQKVIQVENIIKDVIKEDLYSMSSTIGYSGSIAGLGTSGSHLASIRVSLTDKDIRLTSIWDIVKKLSTELKQKIVDASFKFHILGTSSTVATATGGTDAIVVEVTGENLTNIYEYSKQIAEIIKNIPGTRDIKISHKEGMPELQFQIKRKEAVSLGVTPLEIAMTIRTAYKGSKVSHFTKGDDDYDVILILGDKDRNDLSHLSNLFIVNKIGTKIPIENLVEIKEGTGPLFIKRTRRVRSINVLGSLTGDRPLNRVMENIKRSINTFKAPPLNVNVNFSGSAEHMKTAYNDLFWSLIIALLLVYMVMASQFESLLHPFIVMFSVPFAIIGLVLALLITNTTFSIISFIGGILLIGIVVNNAIVLIDYMNLLQKTGLPLRDVIIQGGKTRLKPILMTTFTTIFGLLPMSLGFGTGSELRYPIGRAVIGGLLTSTLVTLVLIPTIYWIIESKLRAKKQKVVKP